MLLLDAGGDTAPDVRLAGSRSNLLPPGSTGLPTSDLSSHSVLEMNGALAVHTGT